MKKTISLFTVTSLVISTLLAQAPAIQWQKTIGGRYNDYSPTVRTTPDGGYILAGTSCSDISGDKTEFRWGSHDYWAVKMDASRHIQWQRDYGGNDHLPGNDVNYLRAMEITTDGGYLLGGFTFCGVSGNKTEEGKGRGDYWIVKLDAAGQNQWQRDIGDPETDEITTMHHTTDGGCIVGGDLFYDYWVFKLDNTGNVQWQRKIDGGGVEYLSSVQQTTDGGYILGGSSRYLNLGDYWVVKLNAAGGIEWEKTLDNKYDDLKVVRQTADGGYILGGTTYDTADSLWFATPWIVKLDYLGSMKWQKRISGEFGYLSDLQITIDGGYILACNKYPGASNLTGYDYWVVKIDFSGATQWQKIIGGKKDDKLNTIEVMADGGYLLGGDSDSDISGDKKENSQGASDYWVVRLLPDSVALSNPLMPQKKIKLVYPNPAKDQVFMETNAPIQVRLCNAVGQTILTQTAQNGVPIDLSDLPNGVYFLIETETGRGHKILKYK